APPPTGPWSCWRQRGCGSRCWPPLPPRWTRISSTGRGSACRSKRCFSPTSSAFWEKHRERTGCWRCTGRSEPQETRKQRTETNKTVTILEERMIHFIGAGPGGADLITVRGARLLGETDCIIYAGSLVNPALLDYKKEGCAV